MSDEELKSYRLNSLEEPSDEMLEALMQKVAEAARESTRRVKEKTRRMFEETYARIERKRIHCDN